MITSREILILIIAVIILAFSNAFINTSLFLKSLIFFAIILIIYTASKKIMAYYLESKEETKIWSFQRYGLYTRSYFRKPIPIGIILPFILTVLSFGYVPWFAVTESEVKPTSARAAKRHDFYSFSEMTEWHLALIPAAGILSCFFIAIIAYLINQTELAKLAVYFACFNLLPFGKLDGTKIFFGSYIFYTILAAIALIALSYAIFLV